MAALFIITSIWPKRPITSSTIVLTLSSLRTSTWTPEFPSNAPISAAVFLRQIVIEIGNDNFGFLLRESLRRVLADTLPAAGNNDNFSLQHDLTSQNVRQFYIERLSQSRNGFKRRYNGLVFSVLGLALRD